VRCSNYPAKYQAAGNYEINFNAENLTGGIYFYQLGAGGIKETREMILTG